MAPDCATGRYVHVGSYVQRTECLYLRDKWFPRGEFFHVAMDATAAELRPYVVGQTWWGRALGRWDFSDPSRVAAEMFFEWDGTNRTIRATFSVDGTELYWNESIRAIRTHVPWYRCELVPDRCVGTVRAPGLPSMGMETIFTRLMFGKHYAHVILPVNRTYELDQMYIVYMSFYVFGIGELREGEWISFRSGQWGAINAPDSELYVPVSQTVAVDGQEYTADRLPRRLPEPSEQPGVLPTSPNPAVSWQEAAVAPPEGYTFDQVTQTSTYTIAGPPTCARSINQPCVQKGGTYRASWQNPSPPPLPPSPPLLPPGFFTPSPSPPYPATPPDGLRFWSQPGTWGGRLPQRGDTVEIPQGITIIMDVSPPVRRSPWLARSSAFRRDLPSWAFHHPAPLTRHTHIAAIPNTPLVPHAICPALPIPPFRQATPSPPPPGQPLPPPPPRQLIALRSCSIDRLTWSAVPLEAQRQGHVARAQPAHDSRHHASRLPAHRVGRHDGGWQPGRRLPRHPGD